jgi:hypothetical protein
VPEREDDLDLAQGSSDRWTEGWMHRHGVKLGLALLIALVGCGSDPEGTDTTTAQPTASSERTAAPVSPREQASAFPTAVFAGLGDEPVSDELAAELQEVLDVSANGDGLTATVISPAGTWSGATGFAAGHRAMAGGEQSKRKTCRSERLSESSPSHCKPGVFGLAVIVSMLTTC